MKIKFPEAMAVPSSTQPTVTQWVPDPDVMSMYTYVHKIPQLPSTTVGVVLVGDCWHVVAIEFDKNNNRVKCETKQCSDVSLNCGHVLIHLIDSLTLKVNDAVCFCIDSHFDKIHQAADELEEELTNRGVALIRHFKDGGIRGRDHDAFDMALRAKRFIDGLNYEI